MQTSDSAEEGCANSGMIYAPGHPMRDASNCITPFRIEAGGGATFTGNVRLPSGSAAAPAVGVGGVDAGLYSGAAGQVNLATGGTERLQVDSSGIDVTGDVRASGHYFRGAVNFSNVPQCPTNQKLHWTTGSGWSCELDQTGSGSGQIGTLTNGALCRSNGTQVVCDAAAPAAHAYGAVPSCLSTQKLAWAGTAWTCFTDQGLTTEADPEVGSLLNGKWCRTNGSQVICDQDAPNSGSCGGCNSTCGSGARSHGSTFSCSSACSCGGSVIYACVCGVWAMTAYGCFACPPEQPP